MTPTIVGRRHSHASGALLVRWHWRGHGNNATGCGRKDPTKLDGASLKVDTPASLCFALLCFACGCGRNLAGEIRPRCFFRLGARSVRSIRKGKHVQRTSRTSRTGNTLFFCGLKISKQRTHTACTGRWQKVGRLFHHYDTV